LENEASSSKQTINLSDDTCDSVSHLAVSNAEASKYNPHMRSKGFSIFFGRIEGGLGFLEEKTILGRKSYMSLAQK
jgi:hypothetical protein